MSGGGVRGHYSTPAVLVVFWKRADNLEQLLPKILESNPARLYLAGDGPRPDNQEDEKACSSARLVHEKIDWNCEVKTRFPAQNLGARENILSAMEWFFSAEEKGILLEDDIIPSQFFWRYSSELLERYRDEENFFQISGLSPGKGFLGDHRAIHLTRIQHVWGLATWRRSWDFFANNVLGGSESELKAQFEQKFATPTPLEKVFLERALRETRGEDDNWDASWNLAALLSDSRCVVPPLTLVANVGVGEGALHQHRLPLSGGAPEPASEERFALTEPTESAISSALDRFVSATLWRAQPLHLLLLLNALELIRRLFKLSKRGVSFPHRSSLERGRPYRSVNELFWGEVIFRTLSKKGPQRN